MPVFIMIYLLRIKQSRGERFLPFLKKGQTQEKYDKTRNR